MEVIEELRELVLFGQMAYFFSWLLAASLLVSLTFLYKVGCALVVSRVLITISAEADTCVFASLVCGGRCFTRIRDGWTHERESQDLFTFRYMNTRITGVSKSRCLAETPQVYTTNHESCFDFPCE